jgi:hypothetical protein
MSDPFSGDFQDKLNKLKAERQAAREAAAAVTRKQQTAAEGTRLREQEFIKEILSTAQQVAAFAKERDIEPNIELTLGRSEKKLLGGYKFIPRSVLSGWRLEHRGIGSHTYNLPGGGDGSQTDYADLMLTTEGTIVAFRSSGDRPEPGLYKQKISLPGARFSKYGKFGHLDSKSSTIPQLMRYFPVVDDLAKFVDEQQQQ